MVAKLTRLAHKIAIQLHLVAKSCTICSSRSRWQSGNFWIHRRVRGCLENRVLRRLFEPKREEVAGGWRRLHNEKLHNLRFIKHY
jgi:hypothetical protein